MSGKQVRKQGSFTGYEWISGNYIQFSVGIEAIEREVVWWVS
jgi:hypothetical protein